MPCSVTDPADTARVAAQGRCQDGNGECPFVNHEFGAAYSMGYLDDEGTGVLKALASPKHVDVFNGESTVRCCWHLAAR